MRTRDSNNPSIARLVISLFFYSASLNKLLLLKFENSSSRPNFKLKI